MLQDWVVWQDLGNDRAELPDDLKDLCEQIILPLWGWSWGCRCMKATRSRDLWEWWDRLWQRRQGTVVEVTLFASQKNKSCSYTQKTYTKYTCRANDLDHNLSWAESFKTESSRDAKRSVPSMLLSTFLSELVINWIGWGRQRRNIKMAYNGRPGKKV